MYNQSCECQNFYNSDRKCMNDTNTNCGYMNNMSNQCHCMNQCNQNSFNSCPKPPALVAPRKVCVSQQITPVAQPVICPIECRRVNRCMYYPVFYPQYEQTFVNMPY